MERFAPLSGLVFVVLVVAGLFLGQSDSPEFVGPSREVVEFYTDDPGKVIGGGYLTALSTAFLLWFVGSLRSFLRRAEGPEGRLSALAFGGGVVGAAMLLTSSIITMVAGLRADEEERIDPAVATTFFDLANMLFGVGQSLGYGVLLGATAVLAISTGALPKWLGWVTAVIAVGLLTPFNYVVLLAFPFWVIVLSIVLYRLGSRAAASPG